MTTDALSWLDERVPRGSLVRFGLGGSINSLAFYACWAVMLVTLSWIDVRLLWAVAWGATSIMAHFVHRWFTFDNRKPMTWTLPTAIPVSIIGLVGSSLTIGWLDEQLALDLRLLGLVNLLLWGVIVWLMMRWLVFQYKPTAHASPTHPAE